MYTPSAAQAQTEPEYRCCIDMTALACWVFQPLVQEYGCPEDDNTPVITPPSVTPPSNQAIESKAEDTCNTCGGGEGQSVGDPINPTTGNMFHDEVDYEAVANSPLNFKRRYNSSIAKRLQTNILGEYWRHNYLATVNIISDIQVDSIRSNGQTVSFILNNSVYTPDADISMSLTKTSTGWQLIDKDDSIETYDLTGKLLSISDHKGNIVRLSYNTKGQLSSVSDAYSRVLSFSYNTTGQLIGFTNPLGYTTRYTYDMNKRLSSVIYPDSTTKQYVYENTQYPFALTGILNEYNQRTATWTYDTDGRATSSANTNGVDKTSHSSLSRRVVD